MSEKTPTLHSETTRESGLVVPGQYSDNEIMEAPSLFTPNYGDEKRYDENHSESQNEIEDHKAYEEIVNPLNVLHLKESIDQAQNKVGTASKNVKLGLDLKKQLEAIREEYIAEYLQTGNRRDVPRPIPHKVRAELETMLEKSYKELEAMLQKEEKFTTSVDSLNGEDIKEDTIGPEGLKEPKLITEKDFKKNESGIAEKDKSEKIDKGVETRDEDTEQKNVEKDDIEKERTARRDDLFNRLREADSLTDKKLRIIAITKIAEECMGDEDVDIAFHAAEIMHNSEVHSGRLARKLNNTKEFGVTNSGYNDLLVKISMANIKNPNGLKAADMIDMPWLRNNTLKDLSVEAAKSIKENEAEIEKNEWLINNLPDKLRNAQKKIDELQKELDEILSRSEKLQTHKEQLIAKVKEQDEKGDLIEVGDYKEKLKELESKMKVLEEELQVVEKEVSNAEAEKAEIKQKHDLAQSTVIQLSEELIYLRHVGDSMRDMVKGKHSRRYQHEAELSIADILKDADQLSLRGLRGLRERQIAIAEIAVANRDLSLVQTIIFPMLRRETAQKIYNSLKI